MAPWDLPEWICARNWVEEKGCLGACQLVPFIALTPEATRLIDTDLVTHGRPVLTLIDVVARPAITSVACGKEASGWGVEGIGVGTSTYE